MHLYASTHKVHSVARCILTHSHSYAFKRIQMHSLTHAVRESADLPRGWLSSKTRFRMHTYGNAHECIIIRMHQNATHVHAPNCAYMHHVQNAYIRQCTLYQMHLNATLKMRKKASKCIIPECNLHECVKMHKYAIPCSMWRMQSDGMQWKCWKCIGMH